MTTRLLRDRISHLRPCSDAVKWLGRRRSLARAWAECRDGRRMLWWLYRTSPPSSPARLLAIRCSCACARRGLWFVLEGEDRPRLAIEAAERVGAGDLSEEARAAAESAGAAAYNAGAAAYNAGAAAESARAAAWSAELAACADAIRALCPRPPRIPRGEPR